MPLNHQKNSEAVTATKVARFVLCLIGVGVISTLSFLQTTKFEWSQKAALERSEKKVVDFNATPIHTEKHWTLLTVPDSAWSLSMAEPEQVRQQPTVASVRKPLKEKPPKKKSPKLKVQSTKDRIQPTVGSATYSETTVGSSAPKNLETKILGEIVAVIERQKHYPKRAKDIGLQGVVKVLVHVNSQGVVSDYQLEKGGHPLLRRATLEASMGLKGLQTSATQAIVMTIPVRYQIRD